ncbi:MAG: multidrug effflux MFS transporter [Galactobacter sp.]|uniref:multidrug effflux MFS transporter n=1 Tax=Galactobacter sp. TaxID=2676125 RepID=UPI0025C2A812|nr:multidrug effflux MFS transporter [Galactobacter sp.]
MSTSSNQAVPTQPDGGKIAVPLLITLALLSAVAPFATDLYLPAFPEMVSHFDSSESAVQLSLTAFLIGAGVGQVIFGPLSDRVGRLKPLLVGVILYTLASAASALAPTMTFLIVVRLIQGLAGAAGMVIGRAVISDQQQGPAAARAFSVMMAVGGIAPIIAPFVGSLLADPIGWNGLLWIVTGFGVICLVFVLLFVHETRPKSVIVAARAAAADGPQESTWKQLGSRGYLANTLAFAFAFSTMMAYISASPFMFQDLMGLSTIAYGIVFGVNALGLLIATAIGTQLSYKLSVRALFLIGLAGNLIGILAFTVMVLTGMQSLWLEIPLFIALGSLGLVLGNATGLALAHVSRAASGSGSALMGLLQFGLAGVVAPLVSPGESGSLLPLALVMLVASVVANAAGHLGPRTERSSRRTEVHHA